MNVDSYNNPVSWLEFQSRNTDWGGECRSVVEHSPSINEAWVQASAPGKQETNKQKSPRILPEREREK
jgi:hypothetical protein